MSALASELRKQLENTIVQARDKAEEAARSALKKRAVESSEPFSHFSQAEKSLRTRLRARGRQAGDSVHSNKTQSINHLTEELAYEYWHRMLFARFLAENHLLMHPDGVAVSLEECDELAKSDGAPNGFVLAARYASKMLPQVFRSDDVLLEIEFAPEHRLALEKLLASLPKEIFLAEDSLGWVYQFWQTKRKDDVNKSGEKIDAHTLPTVTQLFTEHYMVQFLLHNTIGAWWCARRGIAGSPGGAGTPTGSAPIVMEYLRWDDSGCPAAGTFEGWPSSLKDFTLLDPCCGSGHFLVSAFNVIVPLRMSDERLSAQEACDEVIRENLFGLELDSRCTQIAAFALAFAAWKYPDQRGEPLGYRILPSLNIACSGLGPGADKDEWLKLGGGDARVVDGMEKLYELFQKAPTLGSLINPRKVGGDLLVAKFHELQPLLEKALINEVTDTVSQEVAVTARGLAKAAEILSNQFTLVATNVPYLGQGKHGEVLKKYCEHFHTAAKSDLATCFIERSLDSCVSGGTVALVTPQSWSFMNTYKKFRTKLLKGFEWNFLARLGTRAFETISGEVVNVALIGFTNKAPLPNQALLGLDISKRESPTTKADGLRSEPSNTFLQKDQLSNPDARISFGTHSTSEQLSKYCSSFLGLGTGDYSHYGRCFWEFPRETEGWAFQQCTVESTMFWGGREHVVAWDRASGRVRGMTQAERVQIHNQDQSGQQAWQRRGIAVGLMQNLRATLYTGEVYEKALAVLVPSSATLLPAIWAFCNDPAFNKAVRELEHNVIVANGTLVKVPFDISHWQKVASETFPRGLPQPHSDDPTQWLFAGHPQDSEKPLQVAMARLLGFRWPRQSGSTFPDCIALGLDGLEKYPDADGIVCIPPVRGESPGGERLLDILREAFNKTWSDSLVDQLLTRAGCKAGTTLDDWLRNSFFEQHCKVFHQRPFIWHIWDGRKDGFSCLVNYHKLNYKTLENLTYSHLQDWISTQLADARAGKIGADLRLKASQDLQEKLKLILAGEPPHDIFIRWKPLADQPINWNPDLNDGARMNIRPFVEANILRKPPSIKWTKDRGKEPLRDKDDFPWFWKGNKFVGDRINDVHLTNSEKQAARKRTKVSK